MLPDPTFGAPAGRSSAHEVPSGDGPSGFVRPYALTGGRTRPVSDLAIESQVTATPISDAQRNALSCEQRRIIELCEHPVSVAEIAALAHLPLGVARVLIADLREDGLLVTGRGLGAEASDTVGTAGSPTDVSLLERVLHGLRAL